MTPTKVRMLVALAVVFAVLGWLTAALVDQFYGRLLQVPLAAALALAMVAVALWIWGLLAKPRLRRAPGREPLNPIVAARTAALALAASRTGALVGGFYVGVALAMVPSLQSPAGRQYAAAAAAAAVASLALVAVGLWVESICRLPDDKDREGSPGAGLPKPRPAGGEATRQAS